MKKKAAALILILISALLTGAVLKLSVADRSMAASGAFLYAQEPSDSDNTSDPSPAVTEDDNTMAPETSVIPETASPESDETPFETEPATEPSETEPSETEPSETEPSETETPAPTDVPTEPPTPTPTPEPTPEPLPSVEPHVNTVRIGLKFDKSALDVLTTGSDSGGTIGVLKNHLEYEPVIVFGQENSVTKCLKSNR